ncbi:unnamed protein product [Gemmata massiliana]|uniref:Uncharacterized protein n=1 Tax=Gemmata massiliana TaxID=1210884 RepID=A0A6P2D8M6_9BACT|nr:hypothetical protein [Gemmata massiliana]VTR96504.1 unnamed protein product [Gemmata massiliana]
MNVVLQTPQQLLLSVNPDELTGLINALNEVCHGVHIEDAEFEARIGVSRSLLAELLTKLRTGAPHPSLRTYERVDAWADGGEVQAICVTAFGDPVDMSAEQAQVFADKLLASIQAAGG